MPELQEIYKHPLVQELIEQNQQMAEALPEGSLQHLSLKKKPFSLLKQIETQAPPYLFKDRLLFKEGVHNSLFYPYEEMKANIEQWENADLHMAEHDDASSNWIGLTKNCRAVDTERAIRGDVETPLKDVAQKLAYQLETHRGSFGISPTIDVDKQMLSGKLCAMGPYTIKSQSIVLDPAVRETVFNSAQGGAGTMEPNKNKDTETQQ